MNFLKPAYILELEVATGSALLTDALAVFKTHSTTMWNYSNTLVETSDKKQMQADWCKINKKKSVAGLSVVDKADPIAKRLHVSKRPKTALSDHRMHFVYITDGASLRLFCVWQFINDAALTAATVAIRELADAKAEVEGLRARVAEVEGELAAAKANAMQAARAAEAAEEAEEEAIRELANVKAELWSSRVAKAEAEAPAVAAEAAAAPAVAEAPSQVTFCFCAPTIAQIESRLNALEASSSYSMQLGVMMGLLSANESAESDESASAAESEAESDSEPPSEDESASEAEAAAAAADADDAPPRVIDTKRITDAFGINPAKIGDIITCNIKGKQHFVEVKTVNASGVTFRLLKKKGSNTFRYSTRTPPVGGNLNYQRRLYRVQNARII